MIFVVLLFEIRKSDMCVFLWIESFLLVLQPAVAEGFGEFTAAVELKQSETCGS